MADRLYRRADDERIEALRLRVDLLAETIERHIDAEVSYRDEITHQLAKLDDLLQMLSASKRAGRWLLAIVLAIGAITSWSLNVWHQITQIGRGGP